MDGAGFYGRDIVAAINALPSDWHGSGTMPADGIAAMAAVMAAMQPIRLSMETGSGKTTLLFSHLSESHKVFSLDSGTGSVANVIDSPLFEAGAVEYIVGPTQRTLPAHAFPVRWTSRCWTVRTAIRSRTWSTTSSIRTSAGAGC